MDAGPRGLGRQIAWVSFQAMGGTFSDEINTLKKLLFPGSLSQ
jgi:hypothetical protein